MRALQLLGDARVLPARTPEEFVLALMLADRFPGTWSATYPIGAGTSYARIGGCSHKAIRWAFEAQGLYVEPGGDRNAPGAPPPVDIYLASNRPEVDHTPYSEVRHGPGSYLPVSLHWQGAHGEPAPAWQAHRDAIKRLSGGRIEVEVRNRGRATASGVTVSVWLAAWPAGSSTPPEWLAPGAWHRFDPSASMAKNIPGGAARTFGPFEPVAAPTGRYVVLAQATCADDPVNTDPATGLACASNPTPLVDLVSGDNNLGLLVVP